MRGVVLWAVQGNGRLVEKDEDLRRSVVGEVVWAKDVEEWWGVGWILHGQEGGFGGVIHHVGRGGCRVLLLVIFVLLILVASAVCVSLVWQCGGSPRLFCRLVVDFPVHGVEVHVWSSSVIGHGVGRGGRRV